VFILLIEQLNAFARAALTMPQSLSAALKYLSALGVGRCVNFRRLLKMYMGNSEQTRTTETFC